MRVFRQIIGVGVGAAITFSNAAQSAEAQLPAQSQDSLAPSNQLVELGPNVRSTSNTAPESASYPEQSIALNPPTSESGQPVRAKIASTPPTGPSLASKPQQAAPASPSTLSQGGSTPQRGLGPTDAQQPSSSPLNNVPVPSAPVPILRGTPNESFPSLPPRGILDTKPPASLEPNPNPLLFPTNPEDVRIEQTESITLQQAIDLARRNSQVLQIAQQQVEQSRSALREQQAALYPDLNFQMSASRSVSAGGELQVRAQQRSFNFDASRTGQPARQAGTNFGSNSLSSPLEVNYNIDLFGGRRAPLRAAEEQ